MTTRGNITGETIRAWRTKLGITRAEAARQLKMPESTLKQYETGSRSIPGVVEVAIESIKSP